MSLGLGFVLSGLLALPVGADPRIPLVQQQMDEQWPEALESVEALLRERPQEAQAMGLEYLRGHLLLQLDRQQEAIQSFAQTMGSTPALAPYSRLRLAMEQERRGNPKVAAGLVATLLGDTTPSTLVDDAMRLLERTVEAGGDCRLLRPLERKRWSQTHRRRLTRLQAVCAMRSQNDAMARDILFRLLEEKRDDDIALNAVHALRRIPEQSLELRQRWLIGMTLYSHRQFDIAIPYLARTTVQQASSDVISRQEAFDCRYALARSHFWLERYGAAADAFGALAESSTQPRLKAQCFYQQGRSYELGKAWPDALNSFDQALRADPDGRWVDAALIGAMRLHWLSGQQPEGLQKLQELKRRRRYNTTSRALIFLASTDIVEGRTERAGDWLQAARSLDRVAPQELSYWEGRLAELRREWSAAVRHHVDALADNAYHPYGVAARQRLQSPELVAAAQQFRVRWQSSNQHDELFGAYLLAENQPAVAQRLRRRLMERFRQDPAAAPFLDVKLQPTEQWPLWQGSLQRPDEMLLALGIFDQAAPAVLRHFPVAKPTLAFTGSHVLAQAGATRRSLYMAEILAKRVPDRLPAQLLDPTYRRLLFPFRYSYLILRETQRRDIDPYLLAGLIREESRFDRLAFSAAAARGLTQFVLPTAERIAKTHDLGPIKPQDLENPEVSISLGAAYLYQLMEEFDGSLPQTIAAYNAGEPQAALWRRYCRSDGIDEYLAKVAFRETRNYLAKVLTSRAHYHELYGPKDLSDPPPAATAAERGPGDR